MGRGQAPELIKAWNLDRAGSAADFMREPADPAQAKFSRPLYPYPAWAKYKGSGDPDDWHSFKPVDPQR